MAPALKGGGHLPAAVPVGLWVWTVEPLEIYIPKTIKLFATLVAIESLCAKTFKSKMYKKVYHLKGQMSMALMHFGLYF